MAEVQEFKCPRCGGKLEFDAATQTMLCPFCDSSFDPKSIPDFNIPGEEPPVPEADGSWDLTGQTWSAEEAEQMASFRCQSCGGEIITEATTAATHCPYCGSPVVLTGRVSGTLRPDCVIPFKVTEADAKKAMKAFARSKRFAPNSFHSENRLKEIKGVYVPFWLFDSTVYATAQYEGQKTRHWREGEYDCTEVSYYNVFRSGDMSFANIPVDGSQKMPDDLMESLEPFSFAEAVPFRSAYLSGFLADQYDVDRDQCKKRADARTRASAEGSLRGTVKGYQSVSTRQSEIRIVPTGTKYALFPVWLLNTQYQGQNYRFAMNGQSGRFVGNLPISKAKLAALFSAVAVGVSGLLFALGFAIGLY